MKAIIPRALALLLLSASPCHGQIMPSMTDSFMRMGANGEYEIRATYKLEPGPATAYLGSPYSAQQIFEQTLVLSDGTRISRPGLDPVPHYRDSAGRLRVDYPFKIRPPKFPRARHLPAQVEIVDPVAGYHYILDTVNRVAHRGILQFYPVSLPQPLPQGTTPNIPNPPPSASKFADDNGRPEVLTELLGTRVIDGIIVEGRRTITTYPAGSMGNDRPITTTSETWYSPEQGIPVLTKSSNPSSGDTMSRYVNISRAEPDPSLFQVPAGYQVVDETGPFAITFILR
jgi:hypothetical protein